MSQVVQSRRLTAPDLARRKAEGRRIVALTARGGQAAGLHDLRHGMPPRVAARPAGARVARS
jgi:hypothetical protein